MAFVVAPSNLPADLQALGRHVWNIAESACVTLNVIGPTGLKWSGSGFFVSADGYLITCAHLVLDENLTSKVYPVNTIWATIDHYDGTDEVRVAECQVVGVDGSGDLAVLQVAGLTNQSYLKFGNYSNVAAGDVCFTIGNPQGINYDSIAAGTVRDPNYVNATGVTPLTQLFVSSPTMKGVSGGPVLNDKGEVIGLTAWSMGRYNTNGEVRQVYDKRVFGPSFMLLGPDPYAFNFYDLIVTGEILDAGPSQYWMPVNAGKLRVTVSGTRTATTDIGLLTLALYVDGDNNQPVASAPIQVGSGLTFSADFNVRAESLANSPNRSTLGLTWNSEAMASSEEFTVTITVAAGELAEFNEFIELETESGGMNGQSLEVIYNRIVETAGDNTGKSFLGFQWMPLTALDFVENLASFYPEFDMKGIVYYGAVITGPTASLLSIGDIIITIDGQTMGNFSKNQKAPGDITWEKPAGSSFEIVYLDSQDDFSLKTINVTSAAYPAIYDAPMGGVV